MKVLVTGNTKYGLASEIYNLYPDATFISRETGYDLCDDNDITRFCKLSLTYDVFINNSALYHFYQTWLFDKVWHYWKENNKSGLIINIGSTADRTSKGSDWIYQIEKKSLREISNDRSLLSVWGDSKIRVSYISFGSLATPKVILKHANRKLLDVSVAAKYIQWILTQPDDINLNEISIDPIQ